MNKIRIIFFSLIPVISMAQDSLSVLFVGNSYTYVNDLPAMFTALTNSLGDIATVDSKTNGGYAFQNHLDDPLTHTKIHSKPWDFVVLQGQSQEPSFPTSQVNTQTLPPAVSLADTVYSNNFCSQAIYFMTWGRQNGDPQWDSINTFYKMNDRLRNAYLRITDSAEASVAPVGVAWKYVRDNHPAINLYSGDGSHPSVEGTYLAACTFYASLYRKPALGAPYMAGLDPATAVLLQQAADIAVLDSLTIWHLRGPSDIAIAAFTSTLSTDLLVCENHSWRAQSYAWDFGDGSTSALENPTHTYSAPGTYSVQLVAISECGNDTTYTTVTVGTAGVSVPVETELILRSLGDGQFFINVSDAAEIVLHDINGKEVGQAKIQQDASGLRLDLTASPKGLYFLRFTRNNTLSNLKILNY